MPKNQEQKPQSKNAFSKNGGEQKKIVKQKFKAKLEIEKRKQDFLSAIRELKKSQQEVRAKNKQLQELIKQEKIKQAEDLKRANIQYKKDIANQKQIVAKQIELIRHERFKNKEMAKLEMARMHQETLNKKMQFKKDILEARKERKQMVLANKEEIQKIKHNNQLVINENKRKYDDKKLELAKKQIIHLENLAKQKKELENLRQQQSLNNVNFYKKLSETKRKRNEMQRAKEQEIRALIQKEKNALQLDILKIKNQKLSYKNLLQEKIQQEKIDLEQLKFNTEKLKQEEKVKTIIQKEAQTTSDQRMIRVHDDFQQYDNFTRTFNTNGDPKTLSPINLNNELLKGIVINEVGKKALRIFEKLNAVDRNYPLQKTRISIEEKALIEKVRKLKTSNNLVPISDYAKLAAFINEKDLSNERIQSIIVSVVYNLLRGKKLSFLGGYFSIVKVQGYRKIVYTKSTQKLSKFAIVHLPESGTTTTFEQILAKKLAFAPFISITENIVLANINNEIKVITDVAFMR